MEGMMSFVQPFFDWLLQTTLIASVAICLILAAQKTLGGRLGPRWCHALWLVLIVRMVLPWAPSSRLSLLNLVPSWDRQDSRQQLPEIVEQQAVSPPTENAENLGAISDQEPQSEAAILEEATPEPLAVGNVPSESPWRLASLRPVLPILWLAGAIVIGAYILVSDFALWRIVKRDRVLVDQEMLELFEECKERMDVQSLVAVVPSDEVRSPGLFGFVRPRLLLPREMLDTATREEMRYVFLHELAHLKRRDIYLGWLTSLLQILHWFNPLIWFAFYRMRTDRELACDALVLTRTGQEKSHEYGGAILGLLRRFSRPRRLPAMAGIIENRSQLKRRIAMITQFKNNSYQWSPLAVALIIILGCVSLPDPKRTKAAGVSAAKPPPALAHRQVIKWGSGLASLSPDGRYLSDMHYKKLQLMVLDLATGEERLLTNKEEGAGVAMNSAISPDSKRVAFLWYDYTKKAEELCIIGFDGSDRRVLRSLGPDEHSTPLEWSPDGKRILVIFRETKDENFQLAWVSVKDGSVQVFKTLGEDKPGNIDLSPDGRSVAYDRPQAEGSSNRDIFQFIIGEKRETPLVQHPGDDKLLGWTPDGKGFFFASNRTGTWDGFLRPDVADRRAKIVTPQIGDIEPIGFAPDGSYYYYPSLGAWDVFAAALDLETGEVLTSPTKVHETARKGCADWSRDGRYLAYSTLRPDGSHGIRIRTLKTGDERELSAVLPYFRCLRWSPDGQSLLATRLDGEPQVIYQIDAQTGERSVLVRNESGLIRQAGWSLDGKTLFYNIRYTQGGAFVARNLQTGTEKQILPGGFFSWALSPDGKRIAVSQQSVLKTIPAVGGEPKELVSGKGFLRNVAWTPDGHSIIFTLKDRQLWRVPAEGGEPRRLWSPNKWFRGLRLHPDGQRIVFGAGRSTGEVWAMENFLPESKASK